MDRTPLNPSTSDGGGVPVFMPPGASTPDTNALVTRLRTSSAAQDTYNFQALLYEFGYTDAPPDGISGPITQSLISRVQNDTPNLSGETLLERAHAAVLWAGGADAAPVRVVPNALPADVVHLLNAAALRQDPDAVLIQANS